MRTLETVDRALQLLLVFDAEEQRELTVGGLASHLDIHRSSASRLAGTLAQRGFLERVPRTERFRLGPAVARLGLLAVGGRGLISESREAMELLAEQTGEATVLSVLEGTEVVNIAQVSGPHIIGMTNWIGRRTPLHASSDGHIFLAFAGVDLGEGPREALAPNTITDTAGLAKRVGRIREYGWAYAIGELEDGLNGVAAPVWNGSGRCVAALSVSGPSYRVPPDRLPALGGDVQEAAAAISVRLGLPRSGSEEEHVTS